jgi:hypothetical protein
MTGHHTHQRGSSDDLTGPGRHRRAEHLRRGLVLPGQSIDRAVQVAQAAPFRGVRRPPAAAENVTEPAGRDDQGVIECLKVGGQKPVRLVVVAHEDEVDIPLGGEVAARDQVAVQ